jgi:hypothetical protein
MSIEKIEWELRDVWRQQTSTRDDERCRWPECTCYGPQAPNHCKRQTRRTLDASALSEREGQE